MTVTEIKRQIQSLTAKERAEVRAHLRLLDLAEDKLSQAKLFEKLARAKAGHAVDQDELCRLIGTRPAA